jgi:hypothetical protein
MRRQSNPFGSRAENLKRDQGSMVLSLMVLSALIISLAATLHFIFL